jgi:hypothetical protein
VELEAGRLVQCMLYVNSAIAVCPLSLQYYASVGPSKHMFMCIEVVMQFIKLYDQQCITYVVKCASQFLSFSCETAYMKLQTKLGPWPCSFSCTTQWKDFEKKLVLNSASQETDHIFGSQWSIFMFTTACHLPLSS